MGVGVETTSQETIMARVTASLIVIYIYMYIVVLAIGWDRINPV